MLKRKNINCVYLFLAAVASIGLSGCGSDNSAAAPAVATASPYTTACTTTSGYPTTAGYPPGYSPTGYNPSNPYGSSGYPCTASNGFYPLSSSSGINYNTPFTASAPGGYQYQYQWAYSPAGYYYPVPMYGAPNLSYGGGAYLYAGAGWSFPWI